MAEELNVFEKAGLLAIKDHYNEGYDAEFYSFLQKTRVPDLMILDRGIRKAVAKFIPEYWRVLDQVMSQADIDEESKIEGAMTCALLKGYQVGKRLRRSIISKRAGNSL